MKSIACMPSMLISRTWRIGRPLTSARETVLDATVVASESAATAPAVASLLRSIRLMSVRFMYIPPYVLRGGPVRGRATAINPVLRRHVDVMKEKRIGGRDSTPIRTPCREARRDARRLD